MSHSYSILAPIYDEIGMSAFAQQMVPMMLDYAQRNDWLGKHILELGCGTGEGILTLADSNFTVTGIDVAPEMLEAARKKTDIVDWIQEDIRTPGIAVPPESQDMIVAIDVMNEMDNVRELQAVFTGACERLRPGRLFMFDMHTIAGLSKRGTQDNQIIHDENGVTVFASNTFDYERQAATRRHITFELDPENNGWIRMDTTRVLRAFPLQAVGALLGRSGFAGVTLLTTLFGKVDDPGNVDRVVFIATK